MNPRAGITRPTPLAGGPLRPLEYFSRNELLRHYNGCFCHLSTDKSHFFESFSDFVSGRSNLFFPSISCCFLFVSFYIFTVLAGLCVCLILLYSAHALFYRCDSGDSDFFFTVPLNVHEFHTGRKTTVLEISPTEIRIMTPVFVISSISRSSRTSFAPIKSPVLSVSLWQRLP